MNLDVVDKNGKKVKSIKVDDSIFGVETKQEILSTYVYAYLSNQRQANANTKDRSEVSGGGRKPWRQKGTGRARFGSSRNPIWRGGGIAFGPTSDRNYKKKLTKKFIKASMKHALSYVAKSKLIKVLSDIDATKLDYSTKQAVSMAEKIKEKSKKMMLVTAGQKNSVVKSFANVAGTTVVRSSDLNTYDVLTSGLLVIEESAIKELSERLKGKNENN